VFSTTLTDPRPGNALAIEEFGFKQPGKEVPCVTVTAFVN
jgi:hypothetical protein